MVMDYPAFQSHPFASCLLLWFNHRAACQQLTSVYNWLVATICCAITKGSWLAYTSHSHLLICVRGCWGLCEWSHFFTHKYKMSVLFITKFNLVCSCQSWFSLTISIQMTKFKFDVIHIIFISFFNIHFWQ